MQNIKHSYDLVVIGGGPAGTPVAIEYAKLNSDKNIALIDMSGELGGECLFQGCIPSKIMEASAKHIKELKSLKEFGIELDSNHYQLIWDKIKQRKDNILNRRTNSAKETASDTGNIDIIKGYATFSSKDSIKVTVEENIDITIHFKKALIATGSKAKLPSYSGNAVDEIITNEEFFADMILPKSLSIIGSGAIAIEFAQILSALGVQINLFVRGDKILKNIDNEATKLLIKYLEDEPNIKLLFNTQIQEINHKDNELEIIYTQNNQNKSLISQKVLSAIGRVPNIDLLNLESADVEFNSKGIITKDNLQTTNKNIFANGDVVADFPRFAHTAQYTAHLVAQNLFLEHNFFKPDFSKNSWVLFSMPNIAVAGISEEEAKQQDIEVIVDKFDFSTEAKSQIENEDFGFVKFIVDKKSLKILGIVIIHTQANSIAGEASLIVAQKLTLKELIDTIHPHPTISESFVVLAKTMMGNIMLKKLDNLIVQTLLKIERIL